MSKDIPNDFRIHLSHEAVNPIGFVRSKGKVYADITLDAFLLAASQIRGVLGSCNLQLKSVQYEFS